VHEGFSLLLRAHRLRRRLSQEALASAAQVSARHLSCLETGKAEPSRDMVAQLARVLGLALREHNTLLVSAGFAPSFPATPLDGAAMAPVGRAIDFVLAQQEPYAALLIDRCWNVLRVNAGAARLLAAFVDPARVPPAVAHNLVRATLHPEGLRPFVVNWTEVSTLVLERLERAHHTHPGDGERRALLDEVLAYPCVEPLTRNAPRPAPPVATLHLRRGDLELRLFTLLTSIGTPLDVTAEDLHVESLFPADDVTERWFRAA
jgi:transcriptional regulator with XRE-family HTH domain